MAETQSQVTNFSKSPVRLKLYEYISFFYQILYSLKSTKLRRRRDRREEWTKEEREQERSTVGHLLHQITR